MYEAIELNVKYTYWYIWETCYKDKDYPQNKCIRCRENYRCMRVLNETYDKYVGI